MWEEQEDELEEVRISSDGMLCRYEWMEATVLNCPNLRIQDLKTRRQHSRPLFKAKDITSEEACEEIDFFEPPVQHIFFYSYWCAFDGCGWFWVYQWLAYGCKEQA